jgi:hypothetical protein
MMNDFQALGNKESCFGVKASNQSWQELFIIISKEPDYPITACLLSFDSLT